MRREKKRGSEGGMGGYEEDVLMVDSLVQSLILGIGLSNAQ